LSCAPPRGGERPSGGPGFVREIGKHSTFWSNGTSRREASATPGQSASRDSSHEERKRIWRGEATGNGEDPCPKADCRKAACRKTAARQMGLSRRHPICSTERAFQLKLATSVIAHLFSVARSQGRSLSKATCSQRQLARAVREIKFAPQRWLQKEPGS
jgi:hypothetical protein